MQAKAMHHEDQTCHADSGQPAHIAIIMDGNARWAQRQGVVISKGHHQGAEALRTILTHANTLPFIEQITVYAFSSENWKRPEQEVHDLMDLLRFFFRKELNALLKENIRIRFIGERSALAKDIQEILINTEIKSASNTGLTLTIALSYGSRQEITEAAKTLAQQVVNGSIALDDITPDSLESALQTHGMKAPDLLIRTGGEQRLSNFLLWQCAYAELYFTDLLWPDFDAAAFDAAIYHFTTRQRRFGGRS